MNEFLAMGGYAAYVWPAYAISAVAFSGLVYFTLRRGRRLKRRLEAAQKTRASADEPSR